MPTCRHYMYVMFGCRQYRRGVKPCRHADMPTCRQYPILHLKTKDISGLGSKQAETTNHWISQIGKSSMWATSGGRGGGEEYMPTCRHADSHRIVHLIFSCKKFRVVIKTCRHADTICISCFAVGNIGGGQTMPTCRHADNILWCGLVVGVGWGGGG